MRIGIDARAAAEVPAGRGRVVREQLRALAALDHDHEVKLYARREWPCDELDERFAWRIVEGGEPWWQARAARRVVRECDVFFATNTYVISVLMRTPAVTFVHDLAPFHRELRLPRGSAAERWTLPLAVWGSASFVCNSDATRRDLVGRYPSAEAKAHAVPLAADARFTPHGASARFDKPYVLCTGTIEPRKNVPRLIEAFAGLPSELRDRFELVLAGPSGWETEETFAGVARHAELVRSLGYVEDDELPALYRGAALVAYPSLFEGFGLPVLEAMASGAAVVTSNLSSLPEVGGDAVRYVDPYDVADLRGALAELLADDAARAALATRGVARAAEFSWRRHTARVLELLEEAAA